MKETITLKYPLTLADGVLSSLSLRRPDLGDLLDCPVKDGSDIKGEAVLLARLCGMNMEDFRKLDLEDYLQVQKSYLRFRIGNDLEEGSDASVRDSVPAHGMGS